MRRSSGGRERRVVGDGDVEDIEIFGGLVKEGVGDGGICVDV